MTLFRNDIREGLFMKPIFKPQTEWIPPESFPDLSKYDEIAIDLETKDPELKTMGSGSVTSKGNIVGTTACRTSRKK